MPFHDKRSHYTTANFTKYLVGIVSIAFLSGCGGGGGSAPSAGTGAHYAITDLGVFIPNKITNSKTILGFTSSGVPIKPGIWQDGNITPFDALGGAAFDLSTSGLAVGHIDRATKIQAATFMNGVIQTISLPDNKISHAYSVNASNDVAGVFSTDSTVSGPIANPLTDHAFLMMHGRSPVELAPLSGYTSADATAINDAGVVAGYVTQGTAPASDISQRAVVWNHGKAIDLNVFAGKKNTQATAINNNGTVVGIADTYPGSISNGAHISFIWRSGLSTQLRPLAPSQTASVLSINATDVSVGQSDDDTQQHAVAWAGTTPVDLQARIPANSGWTLVSAVSINDSGQIVGIGKHNGTLSGFLLTPQ